MGSATTRADGGRRAYFGQCGEIGKAHILKVPKHVQEMKDVHVWGLDPGTKRTGLTVLRSGTNNSFSTILKATSDKPPWYFRGAAMVQALRTYLGLITPGHYDGHLVVGMEMPGVYGNQGDTPVRLGDVRGLFMGMLVCEYAREFGDRLHVYPSIRPSSIKVLLAGDGRASKEMVLHDVQEDYSGEITSFDEADSIGVALLALEAFRKELHEQ
jgi:Holliday junction resolvasome RuvABC endonuclease subunit